MKKSLLFKLITIVTLSMVMFYGCSKYIDKSEVDTVTEGNTNQAVATEDDTNNDDNKDETVTETPITNPEDTSEAKEEITKDPVENSTVLDDQLFDVEKETILFSFKLKDSNKYMTVSTEKGKQEYLVYRFGTKENVELTFPESMDNAWEKYTYSYYMRGGGVENEAMDLNYLEFENNGYRYKIYEEYIAGGENVVGIIVTNIETSEETVIEGDTTTVEGSLLPLRDNDKIKIELL